MTLEGEIGVHAREVRVQAEKHAVVKVHLRFGSFRDKSVILPRGVVQGGARLLLLLLLLSLLLLLFSH